MKSKERLPQCTSWGDVRDLVAMRAEDIAMVEYEIASMHSWMREKDGVWRDVEPGIERALTLATQACDNLYKCLDEFVEVTIDI